MLLFMFMFMFMLSMPLTNPFEGIYISICCLCCCNNVLHVIVLLRNYQREQKTNKQTNWKLTQKSVNL